MLAPIALNIVTQQRQLANAEVLISFVQKPNPDSKPSPQLLTKHMLQNMPSRLWPTDNTCLARHLQQCKQTPIVQETASNNR